MISYYLSLVLDTIGIEDVASQTLINALLQVFSWLCAILAGTMPGSLAAPSALTNRLANRHHNRSNRTKAAVAYFRGWHVPLVCYLDEPKP